MSGGDCSPQWSDRLRALVVAESRRTARTSRTLGPHPRSVPARIALERARAPVRARGAQRSATWCSVRTAKADTPRSSTIPSISGAASSTCTRSASGSSSTRHGLRRARAPGFVLVTLGSRALRRRPTGTRSEGGEALPREPLRARRAGTPAASRCGSGGRRRRVGPRRTVSAPDGRGAARRAGTEVDMAQVATRRADLALFHEFEPPPAGGGHQFLRALVGELERRGLAVEHNRISGGTPACLFNSFNFDFARLAAVRARGLPDGAPSRRADRRLPRIRRRDRRTDRRDQRRARATRRCSSRGTASRSTPSSGSSFASRSSSRTPSTRRSSIRPTRREPLDGTAAARDRLELVAEPAEGRGRARLARSRTSTRERFELTFVGQSPQPVRANPARRARRLARGRCASFASTTSTSPRARTIPARTRCSRRSRAGCPRRTSTAAVTRSSSGSGGLPFASAEEVPDVLDAARRRSRRCTARGSRFRRSPSVADGYLTVLGLTADARP